MKSLTGADRKACVQSWANLWASPPAGLTSEQVRRLLFVKHATRLRATLWSLHETAPGFYVCEMCAGERKVTGAACTTCNGAGLIPLYRMVDALLDLVVTGAKA